MISPMETEQKRSLFSGESNFIVDSKRVIYTPGFFARSALLHLQEIGRLQAMQPHTCTRSNLSSYLFFFVISGSGIIKYEENEYPLEPGDCVFIDCHKRYSHSTDVRLWNLKWIHFYGPSLSNIYNKYLERGGQCCFKPRDIAHFSSLWETLFDLSSSSDHLRDMKINEHLASLLTLIMSESWHPGIRNKTSKRRNLFQIQEYLDRHFHEKITLDFLAQKFFINKFYLTRIFRDQFGMTLNNYILQKRITQAKQLLRFSDLTLDQICVQCGMEDPGYFSRIFKKVEGISPSVYRKNW